MKDLLIKAGFVKVDRYRGLYELYFGKVVQRAFVNEQKQFLVLQCWHIQYGEWVFQYASVHPFPVCNQRYIEAVVWDRIERAYLGDVYK